ncbi:amidohydrolase [Virgibacillus dakarensis]|nr:amidohydrolase [Virgibacillus dakarensis]
MEWIDHNKAELINASKTIWNYAESALKEYKSSKLLLEILEKEGFTVETGLAGMPTAFVATWGSDKPVIGILGEYDALPGLSQKPVGTKAPVEKDGNGHGCGHNIFGVAGAGAAIAAKKAIETYNLKGTIKFYGCPAEETMIGKIYMVRDKVFKGTDVCLTWHPGAHNSLWGSSTLAMNSVKFTFYGKASHAATNPESGRSALKAVQLMDTGVQYLREHIIDAAKIHSTILHGGDEPNVIPEKAQIWYYLRAPLRKDVEEIYERVLNIAKGASLMTDTEYKVDLITGCYQMLPNKVLGNVLFNNMKKAGAPTFDNEDKKLAEELVHSFEPGTREMVVRLTSAPEDLVNSHLHETILEPFDENRILQGSTDVADVSWNVPTAQFNTACVPTGTPVHTWQFTASVGSGIGQKGMLVAAKTIGLSVIELMKNHNLVDLAKKELENELLKAEPYVSPLPVGADPPVP